MLVAPKSKGFPPLFSRGFQSTPGCSYIVLRSKWFAPLSDSDTVTEHSSMMVGGAILDHGILDTDDPSFLNEEQKNEAHDLLERVYLAPEDSRLVLLNIALTPHEKDGMFAYSVLHHANLRAYDKSYGILPLYLGAFQGQLERVIMLGRRA